MDAHDALDSLLGRLTSILVNEAQLLGRVRGDVEFIKDEMECMNSLILQLAEAQHRDYLVRAWMKQVVGLTRDCEGNVEPYIHYVAGSPSGDGLLEYLRRVVRFMRIVLVRHRIATQIRKLKVRTQDVGDRRQRYGVTVPPASATAGTDMYDGDVERASDEEDLRRRAVLFEDAEPPANNVEVVQKHTDTLIRLGSAHRLSIHNRIGLQKSHSAGDSKELAAFLPSLAASPEWKLLKVLDLEGCQGLANNHLKSVCKILLLKYLSIRDTDVTELPKQIKELRCLETLDIRQTMVQVLSKKPIVLPLLKYFLAGHKVSASEDTMTSEESIATVSMPLGIQKMKNMEILSHVQVTDRNSELAGIAQLRKLRKLGVALHGKSVKLSDFFCQVEKLHKCLRSLSIRMCGSPAGSENDDAEEVEALRFLPQFIERLNICGITSRLVYSKDHHQLAKIKLSDTYLKEDDLRVLGNLGALRGLKLQHKSYTESELFFKKCEFQSLTYLLVQVKEMTRIRFAIGAAPKLERILWTFETMDGLSGIDWLPRLKKLELNGDCDLDPIKEALEGHPSGAILEHKPQQQHQAE
ncbi:unnamed protein product [Urochloa decumbens]|uniref:Rx N-terminal domain-containing protein n=1 Tax=Urochloa decumbens TaxID=240449 RepID=A0ABC9AYW8_9POAL